MKDLFEFTTTDSIFFLVLVAILLIAYFANKVIDQRHADKIQIGEYNKDLVCEDKPNLAPTNYFIPSFKVAFNNLQKNECIKIHVGNKVMTVDKEHWTIFEDCIFSFVHEFKCIDKSQQIYMKLDKIVMFEVTRIMEDEQ